MTANSRKDWVRPVAFWRRQKQDAAPPPRLHDGTIAVTGGNVLIRDPDGGGRWPILIPGEGLEVLVDGQLVTGPAAVSAGQTLTLRPVAHGPLEPRKCSIVVTEDGMEVRVVLGDGRAEVSEVPDHPPVQVLRISAQRRTVRRPSPSVDDLLAEIHALQVAVRVDHESLQRGLDSPEPGEIVVARGNPPTPPVPGQITLHFDLNTLSVEPGIQLATRTEAIPGSPGLDVFGQRIDPDPAAPSLQLKAGPGASLIRGGTHCVAIIQGRPQVQSDADGNLTVGVQPCLIIPGDVTVHNAPPEYAGDLVVQGWVRQSVHLSATGQIQILGGVEEAQLHAAGSVFIQGGCIRTRVCQGRPPVLFRRARPVLTEILGLLAALHDVLRQLREHLRLQGKPEASVTLGQVVNTQRFARLFRIRDELGQIAAELPQPFQGRLADLYGLLNQLAERQDPLTGGEWEPAIADSFRMAEAELATIAQPRSTEPVRIYYALHAQIHAESDVVFLGPGAESTVVSTLGSVKVNGSFRGGWIEASGDVHLSQVGSPAGLRTVISVPAGRTISARLVHPNTTFETGTHTHHFEQRERYITVGEKE